jgi:malic enzyme
MNAKLISKTLVSSAISAVVLLSGAAAQAALTRADLDETNFALGLKEAGYSFPSIEEAVQVRRVAIAKAEAAKSQTAVAKAKDANATSKN